MLLSQLVWRWSLLYSSHSHEPMQHDALWSPSVKSAPVADEGVMYVTSICHPRKVNTLQCDV